MVQIEQHVWGMTPEGEAIILYTMRNDKGAEVKISNFGAAIVSVTMPDREGRRPPTVCSKRPPDCGTYTSNRWVYSPIPTG